MKSSGFRIMEVSIEGFKGFTKKQSLHVEGKHLFLLGPNGYGKSSVLEAIRWGLFGSTRRPGEVVLNHTYPELCRVELLLNQGGKSYRLRRTLLRGVTGGTDPRLFDEFGQEQNLKDVMPQLDSAAAGEGMHLVFTAQAAKQKKAVEDLKPFERTLYSYLGLTDVRVAIDRLNTFVQEQDAALDSVGKEVGEVKHRLDQEVANV
ncbi:MAG: AAA family ATPase, partial [Chloroflexota bacterium]